MQNPFLAAGALAVALGLATPALAFDCNTSFKVAEAAIATATAAMKKVSNKGMMGQVHTLIDDAKMYVTSGRHHHEKPAAGAYDHARAVAKARTAKAYAEAALIMANAVK